VDAAVVMIENAHKHIERWNHDYAGETLHGQEQWRVIGEAAAEVGPALFFSLLIITLSFIPVFTLEAQEGRLFSPLAFTKTYAMAAAAGLAVTATDPAPLEMFETTIQFKPREQWRAGMTPDKLVEELDRIVKVPGLSNIWVPPIRNRIDMLATGIKSPVGVKVAGMDSEEVDRIAAEIERVVKQVPGVTSAFAERLTGGRYI